ncbi:MAG TPA: TlpA disulfide reductase family protein [Sphingomicrobium sp.]|jgi:thiol-disulfide isomerase/thioredoxin
MRILTIGFAILALGACGNPADNQAAEEEAAATAESVKGVDRSHKGSAAPTTPFNDSEGEVTSFAEFAGKPTLVNLWASWCAPCVKELPTLDRLARERQGKLNVLAISQDTGPHASVEAFLDSHKISNLGAYQDPKMALSGALQAQVLPTSILYDAGGKEVWRYVGDLNWTGPEAAKLLAEAGG